MSEIDELHASFLASEMYKMRLINNVAYEKYLRDAYACVVKKLNDDIPDLKKGESINE